MSARILITGATSVIGADLVADLSAAGVPLRAAVHSSRSASRRAFNPETVQAVKFDFTDKFQIEQALEGIEVVFLLTPLAPEQAEYVGIFIDLALRQGVSHIVRLSFMGADRIPLIRMGRWHLEAERCVVSSGIPYTIIRPNSLMQNFLTRYPPSGGLVYLPLGKGRVSFVDSRDVAAAAARIVTDPAAHAGNVYTLTGPQGISLRQVAETISEVIGTHVEYADISEETARHIMESAGAAGWLVEATLEQYAVYRESLFSEAGPDLPALLGRRPRSFVDFARDYAPAFSTMVEHDDDD